MDLPIPPVRRRLARVSALAWVVSIAMGWLAATACGASGPSAAPAGAQRIISLNPSLTSILVAIGARDALVGVDDFSARQEPEVAGLPTVGGLYNPSLESVVALAPDLVVLVPSAEQRDFRARLTTMGIEQLAFDPVHFDDVLETIVSLGDRVGRGKNARVRAEEIRRVRRAIEQSSAERRRFRTVLVLQREPFFVIGPGNFIHEMLQVVGAENAAAEFEDPYPRVTAEWLIAAQPEVILDASDAAGNGAAAEYWSRWPSLPAVRDGRVMDVEGGRVTLPGPYLDRALIHLAGALHGPGSVAGLVAPTGEPTR